MHLLNLLGRHLLKRHARLPLLPHLLVLPHLLNHIRGHLRRHSGLLPLLNLLGRIGHWSPALPRMVRLHANHSFRRGPRPLAVSARFHCAKPGKQPAFHAGYLHLRYAQPLGGFPLSKPVPVAQKQ